MKSRLPLIIFVTILGFLALVLTLVSVLPPAVYRQPKMPAADETLPQLKIVEQKLEPPLIVEAPSTAPEGMVWIPGGTFLMGTPPLDKPQNPDRIKQDETPVHQVALDGFWMDTTTVTNAQFAQFIQETGYITTAEIKPKREDFIGVVPDVSLIPEENLVAGALIFNPEFDRENFHDDYAHWELQVWKYQPGANWKHPTGPGSSIVGLEQHPVVNVSYQDAVAFCQWAGKRLPTEAEWEYACRGGKTQQKYPWGNELNPGGKYLVNYWQGKFPVERKNLDGFSETAPVKSFPPNDFGLYEMSGNVWEWVSDYYDSNYYRNSPLRNPSGPKTWHDPGDPFVEKRVTRGGSFLCNLNNCTGYRCAARMRTDASAASFHTGFRCVIDVPMYQLQQKKNNP